MADVPAVKKEGQLTLIPLPSEAMEARPKVRSLAEQLRVALRDKALGEEIMPYLLGHVPTGSPLFDRGVIMSIVMAWDGKKNHGQIAALNMSWHRIWQTLYRQLSEYYDMHRGHVVGLRALEDNGKPVAEDTSVIDEIA